MNVFEAVKQSVTTRQAAEHYGIHVNSNGMACCPFHNDKSHSEIRQYHRAGRSHPQLLNQRNRRA